MAFQPVNNTAKFDCIFAVGHTERAQFSVYCNNDGSPWDAAQLGGKADDIAQAIKDEYIPRLSVDHDFLGVVARDLEVQFGRVEERFEVAAVPGTLNEPSLPGNVAICCTFKSAVGAPRRGRIFLLPPTEGQVVKDLVSVAAQGFLQGAMEALSAAITSGAGNSHVIVSRFSGTHLDDQAPHGQTLLKPTPRNAGLVADVSSVQVKRRTDSMRSRLTKEPA